jgi:hypothetical protein
MKRAQARLVRDARLVPLEEDTTPLLVREHFESADLRVDVFERGAQDVQPVSREALDRLAPVEPRVELDRRGNSFP